MEHRNASNPSHPPRAMNYPCPPPPTNNLVTPLLTDLYQITMAYGYWKTKMHHKQATFEVFFRKNPFKGGFTIFAGIDEVIKFVAHYKFTEDDINYLKSLHTFQNCEQAFFDYLSALDCSEVTIRSAQMGSVVFPRVPLLVISGPIVIVQLLETTILNLVNFPSLIATNASRMVIAARGQFGQRKVYGKSPKCAEFGLRRAQGPDGGLSASKYCMVGGFDAVANVLCGKLTGMPVIGTHAHSFVMSFDSLDEVKDLTVLVNNSENEETCNLLQLVLVKRKMCGWNNTNDGELASFIAYGVAFPNAFLCLIDTYDTIESGLKNFIVVALALKECGYTSRGIRLDSGDLAQLSIACQEEFIRVAKLYNQGWLKDCDVVASNDINEKTLHELNERGHGITSFGIGTNLVTCQAQPALGCVFKLVQFDGQPRIKLSNDIEKVLIPGEKRAFRLYGGGSSKPMVDLMICADEDAPQEGQEVKYRDPFTQNDAKRIIPTQVEEILHTLWSKGKVLMSEDMYSLTKARERCMNSIQNLDQNLLLEDKEKYPVCVSEKLHADLYRLWESKKDSSSKRNT